MRFIPKNTKLKNTIWKNYSLIDMIVGTFYILIVFLIMQSNIPGKLFIAIFFILFFVITMMPYGEALLYQDMIQAIKYTFSKKEYIQNKGKSTIDTLVPFVAIEEDGTIVYPGYYGKAVEISQKEFGLEQEFEQEMDIKYLADLIRTIEGNEVLDIVKIDRPFIFDKEIKKLQEKINFEKDEIAKKILSVRKEQLEWMNTKEKQYHSAFYLVLYENSKEELKNIIDIMNLSLQKANLQPKNLDAKETAIFLKYCNTRNFDEREIDSIDIKDYVKWIKPEKIKFGVNSYEIDGVKAFTYAIGDYPLEVANAWMSDICDIDHTKVVMHLMPVDTTQAVHRVDKVVNELQSRQNLYKASQLIDKETHIETMVNLLKEIQNENEGFVDVVTTITGFNYDNTDIRAWRKGVRQAIINKGFKVDNLWNRQLEGFVTSNISKRSSLKYIHRGINTSTLAAAFPFVNPKLIEEDGILFGFNKYPVMLNIWKRGANYQNSNMITFGKPGAGKSYFLKNLIVNLYAENTTIFVLDPENEYDILVKNLNGTLINVGNASQGRLNPFHIYKILTEDGTVASSETMYYSHLRTLESFFKIILDGVNSEVLDIINNGVAEMYTLNGILPETDVSNYKAEDFPTFEDLMDTLVKKEKIEKSDTIKSEITRAMASIKKFTKGGRYSDIWNGPSTLSANEIFTVFNFQSLFADKNNIVANAQMLLVFRFLEQEVINIRENNKKNEKKHIAIIADEAHLFIDPKLPIALDFFYQMAKRIRKYDGTFIPATQNIADWNANAELNSKTSAVLKNTQYSFVFGLNPQDVSDLCDIYKQGSPINEVEQNLIITAQTGRSFFIGAQNQRSSLQIFANKYAEKLFTTLISNEKRIEEKTEGEIKNENNINC